MKDKAKKADNKKFEEVKNVPYQLPEEWRWVRLGEIAEINPKKSEIYKENRYKKNDNLIVSFIPMSYVDDIKGKILKQDEKSIKEVYKGYTYFKEGDIVFAKITPCMENGKCAIAENLMNGIGFGSTEFHVIRVKENISNKLIWFYLRLERTRNEAKKYFTGAVGHKRVPKEVLENFIIPLPFKNNQPDLEKQKQIVEKIEAIFEKIDEAITLRQKALEDTKKLFESVLNKIFKEAEEDKENWKWVKLGDGKYTKIIKSGIEYFEGNKKYLSTKSIQFDKIVKIEKIITFDDRPSRANMQPVLNSIWFAKMINTIKVYNFSQKNENEIFEFILSTGFLGLIYDTNSINGNFLKYIFLSNYFNKIKNNLCAGTTQKALNNHNAKLIKIPIPYKNNQPDLQKQKEIAEYLDNLHNKIKTLEELQKIQLAKFKELKESILNKAFRGELV